MRKRWTNKCGPFLLDLSIKLITFMIPYILYLSNFGVVQTS